MLELVMLVMFTLPIIRYRHDLILATLVPLLSVLGHSLSLSFSFSLSCRVCRRYLVAAMFLVLLFSLVCRIGSLR